MKIVTESELGKRFDMWISKTFGEVSGVVIASHGQIKQATVYDWISGRSQPKAEGLQVLYDLGCNLHWLLGKEDGPMFNDTSKGRFWAEKNGVQLGKTADVPAKAKSKKAPPDMISELEAVIEKWR